MQIKEITTKSTNSLREALAQDNTGIVTEDMVNIVRAHEANEWDAPVDGDAYLKQLTEGKKPWAV
jgi:hypothetical protein